MKTLRRFTGQIANQILKPTGLHITRVRGHHEYSVPDWAKTLTLPPSHPLFNILEAAPHYQTNLRKIATAISNKYPGSKMIDVGANVGDTAALIRSATTLPIICVEGDPVYFEYLVRNTSKMQDVKCAFALAGDGSERESTRLESIRLQGTMRLVPAAKRDSAQKSLSSVDELTYIHWPNRPVKLLKIDTDGFDTKVLRGSKEIVHRNEPIVFFEYTPDLLAAHDPNYLSFILNEILHSHPNVVVYDHLGTVLYAATGDAAASRLVEMTEYLGNPKRLLPYVDLAFATDFDRAIITNP